MKKLKYVLLLCFLILLGMTGCSKDKKNSETEESKQENYSFSPIDKPEGIQNVEFLSYMENGELRIGGTDQSGEKRTIWDSKDDGKSWGSSAETVQLPDSAQKVAYYKYASDGRMYICDNDTITIGEDAKQTISLKEAKGYYIDSILLGKNLFVLIEEESGAKRIWHYDTETQQGDILENDGLSNSLDESMGFGCLAGDVSGKTLYAEGDGIIKYDIEKDKVSSLIKKNMLSKYVDLANESLAGMAVKEKNIVICTRDSESESHLYLLTQDGKTEPEKAASENASKSLEVYSLKENNMVRNSLAPFRREHTDIPVNYTVGYTGEDGISVSDAVRKLNTEIMAGDGPDVIVLDHLPMEQYISKGILEPINDVVEGENTEYFQNIIEGCNPGDKIYVLPTKFRVPVIMGSDTVVSAEDSSSMLVQLEAEGSPALAPEDFSLAAINLFVTSDVVGEDEIDESELTEFYQNLIQLKELSGVTEKTVENSDYSMENAVSLFPYGGASVAPDIYFGDAKAGIASIALGDNYIELNSARKQTDITFDYLNKESGKFFIPSEIIGINSSSTQKDAAKEFLKSYLSEGVQGMNTTGFSINRTSMKKTVQVTEAPEYYTSVYQNMESSGGLDLYTLTSGELEELLQFLESADTPVKSDAVVMDAVMEQADKILFEGADVQEAVRSVSSKMNIYLKE